MLISKDLDEIDRNIIQLLQDNPLITHSMIAKKLNRSQPAIGARIKKLTEKGILATQIGVNFKVISDLNLVKVELISRRPESLLKMAELCPYIINALKLSGEYNILLFMACSSLKRLDIIIDRHFRNNDDIKKVRMDLITGMAKQFVLPIDFRVDDFKDPSDPCDKCKVCEPVHLHKKIEELKETL